MHVCSRCLSLVTFNDLHLVVRRTTIIYVGMYVCTRIICSDCTYPSALHNIYFLIYLSLLHPSPTPSAFLKSILAFSPILFLFWFEQGARVSNSTVSQTGLLAQCDEHHHEPFPPFYSTTTICFCLLGPSASSFYFFHRPCGCLSGSQPGRQYSSRHRRICFFAGHILPSCVFYSE